MAEFKVRDLGEVDSKSVQEVEKELLEKHEQQFEEQKAETPAVEENKEKTKTFFHILKTDTVKR